MMWRLAMLGMGLCGSLAACSAILGIDDLPEASQGTSDAGGNDAPSSDAQTSDGSPIVDAGPTAFHLIAPLSTTRVSKRRPTLRWALQAGVTDATVDLCSDRQCTKPIGTPANVIGAAYAPSIDLPSGVVYWRVHSGTQVSPTWQFTVGFGGNAAVDNSSGTTLDLNGDGYSELAIGASGAANGLDAGKGLTFLFSGGLGGISQTPDLSLASTKGGGFGGVSISAGDVNGDGFGDLLVCGNGVDNTGRAYIYSGSPTGIDPASPTIIVGPDGSNSEFCAHASSAGDVNGDGYGDIVIGAPLYKAGVGRIYVYLGGPSGLDTINPITREGDDGSGSYGRVGACDLNADGYTDVLSGADFDSADDAGMYIGRVFIYMGGPDGIAATPSKVLTGTDGPNARFGFDTSTAGDVNGDGYDDIVIGAFGASRAYVFLGSASGLSSAAPTTLVGPASTGFGYPPASAGDTNGDGYGDVIVGANGYQTLKGIAYLYLGGPTGLATTPAVTFNYLEGPDGGGDTMEQFGSAVASAGSLYGNGYSDVVVGGYFWSGSTGIVGVYAGGSSGVDSVPAKTLIGPGANSYFGLSVFGASN